MTWALGAGALAVSLLATPGCIWVAHRTGTVDRPGSLKPQVAPVAYLGGLAVLAGTAVGALHARPSQLIPLAAAAGVGVVDDRAGLAVWPRLAGQVLTGVLVAVTSPVHLSGALGTSLIVVATIVLTNGVNLLDGLDMLAGGVGLLASVTFAIVLPGAGRDLAAALAGGLLGFVVFNRPPARIYLGDGGTYVVGAALTLLLASAWAPGVSVAKGTAMLCVVVVPAAELLFALTRRARGRRAVTSGDRAHPYDRLVGWGWPPLAASGAYWTMEAATAVAALVAWSVGSLSASVTAAAASAVAVVGLGAASGALAPSQPKSA